MRPLVALGWSLALVTACSAGGPSAGALASSSGGARGADASAAAPDGPPPWLGVAGERLAALPPQTNALSAHFATSDVCAGCHSAGTGAALRDAKGRDVSPVTWWRPSMMSLAARDPYFLAATSGELAAHGGAKGAVERTCTTCHAPEGATELRVAGSHLSFADLTAGATSEANLGREGVGCTLCHQIASDGLGTTTSFTGGFVVGDGRQIFGPHDGVDTSPMSVMANYTPTFAAQITESKLCATCHTVITKPIDANGNLVGGDFVEQAAYLEWQGSDYDAEAGGPRAQTCQGCHVPTSDEDGAPISTAIASTPANLAPRTPVGRHALVGGNAYMLRVIADNRAWAGPLASSDDMNAQAARVEANLQRAAKVSIASTTRAGGGLEVVVTVENQSGHKLPTGHPSRRVWLHVKVSSGGAPAFESGRADAYGRIVDAAGHVLDHAGTVLPHREVVASDAEVQVYESVAADVNGKPVYTLLDAASYLKDDRLPPAGWTRGGKNAAYTAPVGVSADANFGPIDTVTYRVASAPAGPLAVDVELLYESVRPAELEALAAALTSASRRFFDMVAARAPVPAVIGRAHADVH